MTETETPATDESIVEELASALSLALAGHQVHIGYGALTMVLAAVVATTSTDRKDACRSIDVIAKRSKMFARANWDYLRTHARPVPPAGRLK